MSQTVLSTHCPGTAGLGFRARRSLGSAVHGAPCATGEGALHVHRPWPARRASVVGTLRRRPLDHGRAASTRPAIGAATSPPETPSSTSTATARSPRMPTNQARVGRRAPRAVLGRAGLAGDVDAGHGRRRAAALGDHPAHQPQQGLVGAWRQGRGRRGARGRLVGQQHGGLPGAVDHRGRRRSPCAGGGRSPAPGRWRPPRARRHRRGRGSCRRRCRARPSIRC